MVTKAQKVRLGVFFLIGFTLFITFLFVIIGSRILERMDTYYIAYEDVSVSGLQIGAQVKYHGIRVGRVENISIDPDDFSRVIVEIKVEKNTPIREDTEATLLIVGITGLKQVELFGGTPQADLLEPGEFIKAGKTFFDDMSVAFEELTVKMDRLLSNMTGFTGPEMQDKFSNLLSNLEEVSLASLSAVERFDEIARSEEIQTIVDNTAKFSTQIGEVDFLSTMKELDDTIQQANQTFTHLDLMIIRSRRDVLVSLETMKEAVDNLEEFSRQISEDPTMLLRRR